MQITCQKNKLNNFNTTFERLQIDINDLQSKVIDSEKSLAESTKKLENQLIMYDLKLPNKGKEKAFISNLKKRSRKI